MTMATNTVALESPSEEVAFATRGGVGVITLNRPKALNALTLEMIRAMRPVLEGWASEPAIAGGVIEGEGEKAFCAGGDVRAVWKAGKEFEPAGGFVPRLCADDALPRRFFFEEYQLNHLIHNFPKPFIAILDGVTMGGGVGLSIHGSHRIATDRIMCAMPETAIGLFPDVGGSWSLPRMPGKLGLYFALTGARAKTADAVYAGFATQTVPHQKISALLDAFASADWAAYDTSASGVDQILESHSEAAGEPELANHKILIDRTFGKSSVEAIIAALEAERGGADAAFVEETIKTLGGRSPTSMKLAFEQLKRGADQDFETCMTMEFRLAQFCMAGHDFYEGIRAVLVDKDHAPVWSPGKLSEVDYDVIQAAYAPLGDRALTF